MQPPHVSWGLAAEGIGTQVGFTVGSRCGTGLVLNKTPAEMSLWAWALHASCHQTFPRKLAVTWYLGCWKCKVMAEEGPTPSTTCPTLGAEWPGSSVLEHP